MSLQTITDINVDFNDKAYILINAKQNDRNTRFLSISCYNSGEPFTLSPAQYSAYIRYKKADGYAVFNMCEIDKGKILVELTEQMLATQGVCSADLVITNKGKAQINSSTGEIIAISDASVISTMVLYINVIETPVENSEIESSYEYSAFNDAITKVEADFQNVILTSKSYAVGGTGVRDGENLDNAKYYAELALKNAYGGDSIVTGIKCANDTNYRNGQVTINAYNVGAVSTNDVASVNEVMSYLGI